MHRTKLVSDTEIAAILSERSIESILTEEEGKRLSSFLSPRRKQEWLSGRIAAKWLLGDWLEGHFAIELNPNQIEILNDEKRKPYVSFRSNNEALRHLASALCVSISHIEGFAIAAFSTSQRVGVDLVRIKEIPRDMQRYFLKEEEIGMAQSFGREGPALFWAIKEAFLKAMGTGFTVSPKSFSIQADSNDPKNIFINGANKSTDRIDIFFEKLNSHMFAATVLTNK